MDMKQFIRLCISLFSMMLQIHGSVVTLRGVMFQKIPEALKAINLNSDLSVRRSVYECITSCDDHPECGAVQFNPTSGSCALKGNIIDFDGPPPVTEDVYRPAYYSDGHVLYQYKTGGTTNDAKATCTAQGSKIVPVTYDPKSRAVMSTYEVAFSDGVVVDTNLKTIENGKGDVITDVVWYNNDEPSGPGSGQDCIALVWGKLIDVRCDEIFNADGKILCEVPFPP